MHEAIKYVGHWLTAVNDHSLHSPFIYNFYTKTLKSKRISEDSFAIEKLRSSLMQSRTQIEVVPFGAESRVSNKKYRRVANIARKGITDKRVSELLVRIIHDFSAKNIIELGTSFGINTMYLGINQTVNVTSFEGCPQTAKLARDNFMELGYSNINLIEGNIDETLPQFIQKSNNVIDFAYIDANHRYQPTIDYFNLLYSKSNQSSILVFDDIHWSAEMSKAWESISLDQRVTLSIDLFEIGILFFKQDFQKQHYRLRF